MSGNDSRFTHALADALREKGVNLSDVGGYLTRARQFGQVGFARGSQNEALLNQLKAAREALLESAQEGLTPHGMNARVIAALTDPTPEDFQTVGGESLLAMAFRMKTARRWSEGSWPWEPARVLKNNDFGRDEMLSLLSGSDLTGLPIDSWERAGFVASRMAGDPPSLVDGSSPADAGSHSLDPATTEARLDAQASALMERFGLGNIRIGGLPSFERCKATLDSLEPALAEIAKRAGIPEKAIGMGGDWTLFINADVGRASGYCAYEMKSICLSEDNGWRTLAHEWFHAFDYQAAASLGIGKWQGSITISELAKAAPTVDATPKGKSKKARMKAALAASQAPAPSAPTMAAPDESWMATRLATYMGAPTKAEATEHLMTAAHSIISGIRVAPDLGAIEQIAREETETSVERMRVGLFERFYKNRATPGMEEQAIASFEKLSRELLVGDATLADIATWRKAHLGEKADMCKHYDAFLFAEKMARDSRVEAKAGPLQESALQRFAQIADKNLAQASGNTSWDGYSTSATEMSARGFEGNCFIDTPAKLRSYLTDGTDGSMYWPVATERGAHTQAYRAFFAAGVKAMIIGDTLAPEVLDGFDPSGVRVQPQSLTPCASAPDIKAKLASRKQAQNAPELCEAVARTTKQPLS